MNKNPATKNEENWQRIFADFNTLEKIEREGSFFITSEEINKYREARLMTKFDNFNALPNIFKKYNLSILPVTRGSYVISDFCTYHNFENTYGSLKFSPMPDYIESIETKNIKSEAVALNCAYVSGILKDFLGEEELFPSINGRMSSEEFDFEINRKKNPPFNVHVKNSQIEIDGGYEGRGSIAVVEAKNFIAEDFLIRQVYYPMRLLKNKFTKKIRPVFMVYSNGIFYLYEYSFADFSNYNSLKLKKYSAYTVSPPKITKKDIIKIFENSKVVKEPDITFPQADNFYRLINLCELLEKEDLSSELIVSNYAFADRQANYYTDAGRYLGLIRKGQYLYSLTPLGKELFSMDFNKRQLRFCELILSRGVFYDVFKEYLKTGQIPDRKKIADIMKNHRLFKINSESTLLRRASTAAAWISWITGLFKD